MVPSSLLGLRAVSVAPNSSQPPPPPTPNFLPPPPTDFHTHLSNPSNTMMKAAAVMLLAVSVAAQEKAKIRFYGESM